MPITLSEATSNLKTKKTLTLEEQKDIALALVSSNKVEEMNQFFIKFGTKICNLPINDMGQTPLSIALDRENITMAANLIAKSASLLVLDSNKRTLIHRAILNNKKKSFRFLVNLKTPVQNPFLSDSDRVSAFQAAATNSDPSYANDLGQYIKKAIETLSTELTLDNSPTTLQETVEKSLYFALYANNLDLLKLLLKSIKDPSLRTKNQNSALNLIIQGDNTQMLELLLNHLNDPNITNDNGYTPLHLAAMHGKANVTAWLLKHPQTNPNPTDKNGRTPLHFAAVCKHYVVLSQLAAHNKTAILPDNDGKTPFHFLAAQQGASEALAVLISRFGLSTAADHAGDTALHLAAKSKQSDATKILLTHTTNPNLKNLQGNTPLHLAMQASNFEIIKLLMAHPQIDPTQKDLADKTPFDYAFDPETSPWAQSLYCEKENNTVTHSTNPEVDLLAKYIPQALEANTLRADFFPSAFLILVKANDTDNAKKLFINFVSVIQPTLEKTNALHMLNLANIKNVEGLYPLHFAAKYGDVEMSRFLIEKGADIHAKDSKNQMPKDCIASRHNTYLRQLLEPEPPESIYPRGLNIKNARGIDSLGVAASCNDSTRIEQIFKAGYVEDYDRGMTSSALKLAVDSNSTDAFVSIAKHINLNTLVKTGSTKIPKVNFYVENPNDIPALHYAATKNNGSILKALVADNSVLSEEEAKIAFNQGLYGVTPLHIAAYLGNIDFITTLLAEYRLWIDIDKANAAGDTALHLAVKGNHLLIVELLLTRQAEVKKINNEGQSALSIATQYGFTPIIDCLKKHKASENSLPVSAKAIHASDHKTYRTHLRRLQEGVEFPASFLEARAKQLLARLSLAKAIKEARTDTTFLKHLIKQGVNLNTINISSPWIEEDGFTPLMTAINEANIEAVQLLLEAKADPNFSGSREMFPLSLAVNKSEVAIVKLLLKHGAYPNLCNDYLCTPLYFAILNGHLALTSILLDAGADPNVHNIHSRMSCHSIAETCSAPPMKELLKRYEKKEKCHTPELTLKKRQAKLHTTWKFSYFIGMNLYHYLIITHKNELLKTLLSYRSENVNFPISEDPVDLDSYSNSCLHIANLANNKGAHQLLTQYNNANEDHRDRYPHSISFRLRQDKIIIEDSTDDRPTLLDCTKPYIIRFSQNDGDRARARIIDQGDSRKPRETVKIEPVFENRGTSEILIEFTNTQAGTQEPFLSDSIRNGGRIIVTDWTEGRKIFAYYNEPLTRRNIFNQTAIEFLDRSNESGSHEMIALEQWVDKRYRQSSNVNGLFSPTPRQVIQQQLEDANFLPQQGPSSSSV